MRIIAIYDSGGNIRGLMTAPRNGASGGRPLGPGEYVGTFDVPDLPDELDPQEMNTRLNEIAKRNSVDTRESRPRLTLKDEKG